MITTAILHEILAVMVKFFNCHMYLNNSVLKGTRKSLLLPWKVSSWIMLTPRMLYSPRKIHLLLTFIEIAEVSINLLHNDNKSYCRNLQKFQDTSTRHLMSQYMLSQLAKEYLLLLLHLLIISVWLFSILFPLEMTICSFLFKANRSMYMQSVQTDFANDAVNISMKNVIKRFKSVK